MTTYAIGDLQGCLAPLKYLLDQVQFNLHKDKLWLVGDLVNRGPDSLETLRFLYRMRHAIVCTLGNHDLHLLAAAQQPEKLTKSDTLQEILDAPDCNELLYWLRQQKLLHYDENRKMALVHAGIPPQWSIKQALVYAEEVESTLRDPICHIELLNNIYGNQPKYWNEKMIGVDRLRVIINYFTRMRFCTESGLLDFKNKQKANTAKPPYFPWFSYPSRKTKDIRIVFGHWASLEGKISAQNIFALDTGCVWGGSLSLLNIDTEQYHRCQC
ncbi:UNVERIFIED_CONTAM: hypothetical protein GTU68_036778 [Idotea baltica]|nr:hypothetical protein [Idotea baltica]